MVRILHVLSERLATGTAKQIELLCQGLATEGFRHWVTTVESDGERYSRLPDFGGRRSHCRLSSPLDVTFVPRFRRQLQQIRPSLIHIWGDHAKVLAALVSISDFVTPIVLARRCFEVVEGMLPFVDRWLGRRVSRFVVNHPQLEARLRGQGTPATQLSCVDNGVPPAAQPPTLHGLHQELQVPPTVRFVAVVGDLCAKKRVKDLLWAMDLLRVIHPQMHLLVLGEGEQRDSLRAFERQVHLDPCVHFLGHRRNVAEILSQCICLWQASRDEGCSNAILEAMAARLPVIASDVPGHRRLVEPSVNGFLVPLGDCAEFARSTNVLLHHEDLTRALSDSAHAMVMNDFSVMKMVSRYQSIYNEVLSRPQRRAA